MSFALDQADAVVDSPFVPAEVAPADSPVAPAPAQSGWRFARDRVALPLARATLLYAYVCAILMFFEDRLIYPGGLRPCASDACYASTRDWAAKETQRPIEDVTFSAPDGPRLSGWFLDGGPNAPVVLMLHGNSSHIVEDAKYLTQAYSICQASVLLMDYRGFGRSQGTPTEAGVLADARAGRKWLADRCGVGEHDVILWGSSLGGGVAIDLAQDGARGLLTEVTFTSLPDAASLRYFMFPVHLLMHNQMNSLAKIRSVTCPTFIAHGDADTLVPYQHSEALYAASGSLLKRHFRIAGMGHCSPWADELFEVRKTFFQTLVAAEPAMAASAPLASR